MKKNPTKYDGVYTLGAEPKFSNSENQASFNIIKAVIDAYGPTEFWQLAQCVDRHKRESNAAKGPQSFVRYCIRSGWLKKLSEK